MVVCTPVKSLPSAGRPSLAIGVARHGCSLDVLTCAASWRPTDLRAALHPPCGPFANVLCTPVWASRSAGDRVPLIWQVTRGPPVHPPLRSGSVPFPPNVDADRLDCYTWRRLRTV